MKRTNHISWDDYFMGVAILSSMRSKDPNTQVGACVVDADNKIVGVGYNGFPIGCSDDSLPWNRDGLDNKYLYVVHAEANCILNSHGNLNECKMYACLFPCNECAKLIIQSGIKSVIYLSDKYQDTQNVVAAKKMFDLSNVLYKKHHSQNNIDSLLISFK